MHTELESKILKGMDHFSYLEAIGRIILKWILKAQCVNVN
jgi:hypothetical protein